MDTTSIQGYTEELQLGHLSRKQYISIARDAVNYLGWHIVSVSEDELLCHTWNGESVTIKVSEHTALFTSRSYNEYYQPDHEGEDNANQFRKAVERTIEKNRDVEKKLKFRGKEALGALLPSKTYIVTPILIYLNVAIFIWMVALGVPVMHPSGSILLEWGGNFRPNAIQGEWWRLFTHMFLHGGIIHLVMNVYALLYIGMFLEPLLGRFRFVSAYLLAGVCGGLMSLSVHAFNVGVGASGAIFGLYGVFLALLTTNHIERTVRNTMLKSILFFVVYNLIYGLQGNIDNAAHIGGLLAGTAIGYAYYPGIKRQHPFKSQLGVTAVMAAAVTVLSFITLHTLTDDLAIFQKKMKRFTDMELMALEVTRMNWNSPKQDILYNLKERGIYYWNENLKIVKELDDMGLPEGMQTRNTVLGQYCEARIKQYEFYYKRLDENSEAYADSIKHYTAEIDELVALLKK